MTDARPRILYIDDDEALARLTQKTLGRRGFDVSLAATAVHGLAALDQGRFDAVVLDHHMPGASGLEALARISALADPPPVVYATGSDEGRIAVAALKAGAADYVIKDVGEAYFELLAEALGNAIAGAAVRREKEAAEAEMRAARDRAELLLREVNHRVANSLAIVASLTHMQAQAIDDPTARDALIEMQHRVGAIAQVHRRLYTSNDVGFVELGQYLDGLVAELNQSLGMVRISLSAEPVRVPTDKAVPLGVVVNELISNACKYAYPAGEPGPVRVLLGSEEGGRVVLAVEDDGIGWTGTGPVRGTGLGSRVIKAMARGLGGELVYAPIARGTRAVLSFQA